MLQYVYKNIETSGRIILSSYVFGRSYIMDINKATALQLERQQLKNVRHYYRTLAEINVELAKIHKSIQFNINKEAYKYATEYVNKYISYTTVWNIKFIYNLESPEVALLQIYHLEYIFNSESEELHLKERRIFSEQKDFFMRVTSFSKEHMEIRKKAMLDYIAQYEQEVDNT